MYMDEVWLTARNEERVIVPKFSEVVSVLDGFMLGDVRLID